MNIPWVNIYSCFIWITCILGILTIFCLFSQDSTLIFSKTVHNIVNTGIIAWNFLGSCGVDELKKRWMSCTFLWLLRGHKLLTYDQMG